MLYRARIKQLEELPVEYLCCEASRERKRRDGGREILISKPQYNRGVRYCKYCGAKRPAERAYFSPTLQMYIGVGRIDID